MEIGLTLLVLFLLPISFAYLEEYNYEICDLSECGGINITYPFYVEDQQFSDCSLPGFQVSCQENLPLLNLSGDAYILKGINYQNQTLWIVNSAFAASNLECISLTSLHNFTLNNPALDFISIPNEIVLLEDCSAKANLQGMSKITCNNNSHGNRSNSIAAVYGKDLEQREMFGECRWAVSVPYEVSDVGKMEDQIRIGFTLKWTDDTNCHQCQTSGGLCAYNRTTYNRTNLDFQCSCPADSSGLPEIHKDHCPGSDDTTGDDTKMLLVGGAIGLFILGAVLFSVFFCVRKCTTSIKSAVKKRATFFGENLLDRVAAHGNVKIVEDFIRNHESMAPRRYTYKDIKKMTKFFREKLGEGGFSVVYKGKLLDGRLVAVKMLKFSQGDAQGFINDVASISRTNHVNVVTLLGFFFEGRKRGLVYEFMPNGSLDKFTRTGANRSQLLSSETLFQIALGIARGLEYLHTECNTRTLHFDIKPHNILLDESFCPKIFNFGLAKLDPHNTTSAPVARGTIGYIAPEVFYKHFGNVSHKSDVYSYGMIVLEMIGCREYANADTDTSSNEYFPDWIYKQLNRQEEQDGDGMIQAEEKGLQRKLISVSLWCIQPVPSSRPSMARVVQILQGSVESTQVGPIVSSPPRPQADPSASSTMLTNDSSFEIQQLQEIPSGATRSSLGVSHSFPTGNPKCHRDPISNPTAGFSL